MTIRYPALVKHELTPELVLLHGWGMSSVIWLDWLPLLRQHCHVTLVDLPGYNESQLDSQSDLDEVLAGLLPSLPEKAIYLGYSLGGMLAVKIADRFPERVSALITLASNLSFVAGPEWRCAMAPEIYQQFYQSVKSQPAQALKRFAGLQVRGAENEKTLLKTIRGKTESLDQESLLNSLQLLSSIDNRKSAEQLSVPVLHLFGGNDNLVPVSAAQQLQKMLAGSVIIIDQAPHCLFLSHPQLCWQCIESFLIKNSLLQSLQKLRILDKKQVARSFSRAAESYDSVADLQRQVGENLLTRLPSSSSGVILDLGCGTGYFSSKLKQQYPEAMIVGVDLAQGMVAYAKQHQGIEDCLCGDAESLPLADNSVDVIFSSLAIQWCEDNPALLAEIYRVLKPSGHFVFSTLGPDTLHELRSAWRAVDNYVHVNRFVEKQIIADAVASTGFAEDAFEEAFSEEFITLEYDRLKELTRELKALGAHNVNSGRAVGLTGKKRMRGFIEGYEQQRNAKGLLPATYQVWYGVLKKLPLVNGEEQIGRLASGS